MILFKKSNDLRKWLDIQRQTKKTIGFIPTMGALHAGHISLVASGKTSHDLTVCSIFVNPTQFNDKNDFAKYPVTIERDIAMLLDVGTDVLFLPSKDELYPDLPTEHYDLGYLETVLEGSFRPGHFQGVCMVVKRLLDIVEPDTLYLGQKDYQQCMVIKKLVNLMDMEKKIDVRVSPTLREDDGLAMSSRNMRLNEEERKKAVTIFNTLQFVQHQLKTGDLSKVKNEAVSMLNAQGFKVDYVEIANGDTLELIKDWDGKKKIVILIAAWLNDVRLIDNLVHDSVI
jgi:pantoate--beta-alanine ligase